MTREKNKNKNKPSTGPGSQAQAWAQTLWRKHMLGFLSTSTHEIFDDWPDMWVGPLFFSLFFIVFSI